MARINTHLGADKRNRLRFDNETSLLWGALPHRAPDPPDPPASHASASAGYHSDLSVPGGPSRTPVEAPLPSQAAQGPAGHYSGARQAYTRALAALPDPIAALSPPAPTGVTRPSLSSSLAPSLASLLTPIGSALSPIASGLALGALTESPPKSESPAQAVISSQMGGFDPNDPLGKKTLGNIPLDELLQASSQGTLKSSGGRLTTPEIRDAIERLTSLQEKRAQIAGPLPGLDPEQTKVMRTVLRQAPADATQKEELAAAEAALVESNSRNPSYGDADSQGWRQERTSIYGTGPTGPTNVRASARRFFEESVSDTGGSRGAGQTAGELAQTIQGSAYPERYDEVKGQAWPILRAFEVGGKPPPALAAKLDAATERAQALGLPTQPAGGRPQNVLQKEKGPYAGARRFVSSIVGQPVWGDKELGHSVSGDHQPVSAGGSGAAYAQDINQPTNMAKEGEPAYNQESLDKIVADLRKKGADVPDLVLGDPTAGNWEGNVNGYRVQIFTNEGGEVSHIHVGARWTGETPPAGTTFGGGGFSGAPAIGGAAPAGAASGVGGAAPAAGSRPSLALTQLMSPLGAGPVLPADVAAAGAEHVESAAENLIAMLGEGGSGSAGILSRRRPTL